VTYTMVKGGRGFDSRLCHWQSFRPQYGPKTDSASNRIEYQGYFQGEGRRPVSIVLKSGRLLETLGPYRDCLTFTLPHMKANRRSL